MTRIAPVGPCGLDGWRSGLPKDGSFAGVVIASPPAELGSLDPALLDWEGGRPALVAGMLAPGSRTCTAAVRGTACFRERRRRAARRDDRGAGAVRPSRSSTSSCTWSGRATGSRRAVPGAGSSGGCSGGCTLDGSRGWWDRRQGSRRSARRGARRLDAVRILVLADRDWTHPRPADREPTSTARWSSSSLSVTRSPIIAAGLPRGASRRERARGRDGGPGRRQDDGVPEGDQPRVAPARGGRGRRA